MSSKTITCSKAHNLLSTKWGQFHNALRKRIPVVTAQGSSWRGGIINEQLPGGESSTLAHRRWYWRRLQRHHRIKRVHELAEQGLSQRAIARQTGHHRKTVSLWLMQPVPPIPADMPADIRLETIILPEKQQRRADNQRLREQVNTLAEQGFNHSAIGRMVGIHRLTVKKWLEQTVVSAETATPDDVVALVPDGWNSIAEIQETRELLRQHRFLFMRRPENLTPEEHEIIDKLLATPIGEELRTIRDFMVGWYRIWWYDLHKRQTPDTAQANYQSWRDNPKFQDIPALKRVISKVTPAKFEPIAHFLHHDHWEATNNGAERMGRGFRQRQAPHYNLRTIETIETAITVNACLRKEEATQPHMSHFHTCQRGRRAQLPA